jgi:hypothetical protein
VARQADLEIHVLCVLFVTIHAIGNQTVSSVALVASQFRVGARIFFHLITLLLVTRKAWSTDGAFQLEIKGGMGISMTA